MIQREDEERAETSRRSALLRASIRWASAAAFGIVVTIGLFLVMMRLSEGSWILEKMIQVFPLTQTVLDPCEVERGPQTLFSVEGTVGYHGSDGFVPLGDAKIIGEHRPAYGQPVEVSPDGVFRFVTGFAKEREAVCVWNGDDETKRLIIRAPGCVGREVRVVRSWTPHRVLLECASRT